MVFNAYGPDRLKYNHGLHSPLDTASRLLYITEVQEDLFILHSPLQGRTPQAMVVLE